MPGFNDSYGVPFVQTGSSSFGSTYTGMFGTPASSPAFGVSSSSPAFGASSSPTFGVSSSPSGAFGQSSCRPFGSPSGFGQTNNEDKDPLVAPKPFGNTSPVGAQTGSSFFGGTSTGVFGTPAPSPAFGVSSSSPAFRASSSPAFGASSSPAFGASSSPTFGVSSSPAFGASSRPAFGVQSSPAFGASSSPAFGVQSSPAFGASSSPAFGASSSPTGPFGQYSSSPFRSPSVFGQTHNGDTDPFARAFNSSVFGSNTPAFGASSTPAFGASNTPAFGFVPTPAFGTTSSAFDFGSSPAFGQQSAYAFGNTPSGTAPTAFGAQPAFGSPGFGQTFCGCQLKGSRIIPYAQTRSEDGIYDKLQSISAMPVYKEKSHEELRREDYQALDKGSSTIKDSGHFTYSPAFYGIPYNPFTPKTWSTNNTQQQHSNLFSSSPAFGQQKADTLSVTCSFNPFNSTPSPSQPCTFSFNSTPTFSSTPTSSLFGTSNVSNPSVSISFNFGRTQSSPLFSPFGQTRQASHNSSLQITINNPTTVSEQPVVVRITVPTNENPCLNLEIEKLMNLRI